MESLHLLAVFLGADLFVEEFFVATVLQCAAYRRNVSHRSVHVVGIFGAVISAGAAALGDAGGNPFALEHLANSLTDVVEVGIGIANGHIIPIARLRHRLAEIAVLAYDNVGVHKLRKLLAEIGPAGVIRAVTLGDNHRGAVDAFEPDKHPLLERAGGWVAGNKLLSDKELILLLVIAAAESGDVAHAGQSRQLLVKIAFLRRGGNADRHQQKPNI